MLFELPNELQIYIFEFDSTYHDEHKKNLPYIALPGTFRQINEVNTTYENLNGFVSYPQLLNEAFPNPNKIINILNKCDCCIRHQNKRPNNVNDLNTESLLDIPGEGWANNNNTCNCQCRHVSRWLCRANGNWPGY